MGGPRKNQPSKKDNRHSSKSEQSAKKVRKTNASQSEPVNWLARLDEFAATQPRAADWLNSYFMFARYPHLEPAPVSEPRRLRIQFESGRNTFKRTLAEWEERIATHEEASRVIEGLDPEQRKQLAALVVDGIEEFELHERYKDLREQITTSTREAGSGKVRKVRRSVEKLQKVQQELELRVSSLHPLLAGEVLSDTPLLESLIGRISSTIDQIESSPEDFCRTADLLSQSFPFQDEPIDSVQGQLYFFFRSYGVSGNDAEVRVGLIRNAFLTEWVGSVGVLKSYQDGESQGCDAVRKAVKRFELAQGKSS